MYRLTSLLILAPALALAGALEFHVETDPAALRFSTWRGFDVVELVDGIVLPEPGLPALPDRPVTLAIPAGARVNAVTVTSERATELPGNWRIAPHQEPHPLSLPAAQPVEPDPATYGSDELFPAQLERFHSTGTATGFRLVSVNLRPLQYRPASGRLLLHERLRVRVDYEPAGDAPVLAPRQRDRALEHLARLVANPGDLARYAPPAVETDGIAVDYLVVTSEALAPHFEPFCRYRTARGLRTEVRTTEWAAANYPGRDPQERLRNLIIDYYRNRGLSYVLLAGDNAQVPCRRIRVYVGQTQGDIPVDLYYADLDFSWDSNNNGLFGEMADSVDFYSDVIVGRASVDNPQQVADFIEKVRVYENDPAPDYVNRALLPSGWLWRELNYHGRYLHDSIVNLLPNGWSAVRMENPPGAAVVADSFNHGFAIFDPAGHGNESGVYDENGTSIYTSGYARTQTNDRRFSVMTSLACTPGNFEAEDCIAEIAHNCAGGGCIAVMMNSRYGWGTPPSMGPSEKLCIRFYDQFLALSEHVLGQAHSRSREEYAGSAQYNSLWRWCMTEFNLLGDPAIDLWTTPPGTLTLATPDTCIPTGARQVTVSVHGTDGPVAGALVCAWKSGEVHATARTDNSGEATLAIHPVTPGNLSLAVTGHDRLADTLAVNVIQGAPEPLLVLERIALDDAGQAHPNGILEPGEEAGLSLLVLNAGAAAAANPAVKVRTLGLGLDVLDSTATFGNLAPGETTAVTGLRVRARPDAYPGSAPECLALVTADGHEWELLFRVPLGHPGRVAAEIDTGACALTVTARGSVGFDNEDERSGRGFRFPETDTSSLNIASFCLAGSPDYVVDRFYRTGETPLDRDWTMTESLYSLLPEWNSHQELLGVFSDADHPDPQGIEVIQRALATGEPGNDDFVVLVYDVINRGTEPLAGLYAGMLADFDITATDRFHDLAWTDDGLRVAGMRNINSGRHCGVQLLYPSLPHHLACLAHDRYIYPDSGLSEDMKYRCLKGELGVAASDRPYNWSVSIGTGPFELAAEGGRRRVAFGFIAAEDSAGFADACQRCQEWFELNVGVLEPAADPAPRPGLAALPPLVRGTCRIRLAPGLSGRVRATLFDASGRRAADVYDGPAPESGTLDLDAGRLAAGVYLLRLSAGGREELLRVTLVR